MATRRRNLWYLFHLHLNFLCSPRHFSLSSERDTAGLGTLACRTDSLRIRVFRLRRRKQSLRYLPVSCSKRLRSACQSVMISIKYPIYHLQRNTRRPVLPAKLDSQRALPPIFFRPG